MNALTEDPLNLLVAGVGGQGNVRMAFLIGSALLKQHYSVSIGDTLGAAQRGGSVTSHVRISTKAGYGPFIPEGRASIILGLEPIETLLALGKFGNPNVVTIVNPRPIYSVEVLSGRAEYPNLEEIIKRIKEFSAKCWIIPATDEALKQGNPVLANVILIGALVGTALLPLDKKSMKPILRENFPNDFDINMMAFIKGIELVGKAGFA